MDNSNSSYIPTPQFYSAHQNAMNNAWAQYGNLAFSPNETSSSQTPFFQYPQTSFLPDGNSSKDPMSQLLQYMPAKAYPSRPGKMPRPNTSSQIRKQRLKPTHVSRSRPYPKRQKVSPQAQASDNHDGAHEICSSVAGSHSECCSSCSDGTPCAETDCCAELDCDMLGVAVVPCFEQSCEKPVCHDPCLTAGIRKQQAMVGPLPTLSRTSNWLESTWTPQIPRDQMGGSMIDPALMFDGPEFASASAPPTPITFLKGNNIGASYSPNTELRTPQVSEFLSQSIYPNQSGDILSGTGAVFNPSAENWQNIPYENSNDAVNSMFNCAWTGCEQPFMSEQDWLSHLHRDHVDPQMTFGCPIQGEECPQIISTNPLDHLQTDHGYNFDLNGHGFSCPAPTCLPGETFLSPAMFHNHFDHVHGVPVQGSLQCRLETCNTSFVDPHDLISHINQHHKIPIPMSKEVNIDTSPPTETAHTLDSLPRAIVAKPAVTSISNTGTELQGQEIFHACKWKSNTDYICGEVFNSEEDLQKHIKYDHLEELDKNSGYKCQWDGCSRQSRRGEKSGFSQRGKLERHMATHTGYKCCACEECGKTFSAEQSLRQHQLLHKGEKPWICKHCGKGFPQQSACTIHERTHTKEKPLECTICGKRFSESSNLSKHRKIHGEKGLNSCDFPGCGKSFHRFDQLKRHRATHERQLKKLRGSVALSEEGGSGLRTESEASE